jgi:hypothetical protein
MAKKDKDEKKTTPTERFGDKAGSNNFQKNPKGAGRKPNPCKAFAQKYGYIEVTPKDVLLHIQAIYGAPLSVLREIIADPEAPHILRLLAREFINAEEAEAKERYLAIKMISEFTDRIAGKAPQHITVTQENNAAIDLSALTEEELLKYTELTSKLSQ